MKKIIILLSSLIIVAIYALSYGQIFTKGGYSTNGYVELSNFDGTTYKGNYKDGKYDGKGTLYDIKGNIIYSGVWKEGKQTDQDGNIIPEKDNYNDTIIEDTKNQVMWHKKSVHYKTLDDAKDFCSNLVVDGLKDWSIPNLKTLKLLSESEIVNFLEQSDEYYWSSDAKYNRANDSNSFYLTFYIYNVSTKDIKNVLKIEELNVRCVRSLTKH